MSRTQQQTAMLCQLLRTQSGREKLTDALVGSLERRKTVNISGVARLLGEDAGEEYAIWAEQCLQEAAERAGALILDNATRISGTLFRSGDDWAMREKEDGEVYLLREGDHLMVYDHDNELYWQGTILDSKREKQEGILAPGLRHGWRVELARKTE